MPAARPVAVLGLGAGSRGPNTETVQLFARVCPSRCLGLKNVASTAPEDPRGAQPKRGSANGLQEH
eukprot:8091531-Pyramimonas_sp.AAC.1